MPLATLRDAESRIRALTDLRATLLVEAGAGTGKTALMAGRIVMLLAEGVDPRAIAAITFTEFAASALDARVHRYVSRLREGRIPDTLELAFPGGRLLPSQKAALAEAATRLDQMTIATIHAFCQTIITSYAVEADIDPGARMLDADQANVFFDSVFDDWIKERFSRQPDADDPIAALSRDNPRRVVDRLRQFADFRRKHREARPPHDDLGGRPDIELDEAVAAFRTWANRLEKVPGKTRRLLDELERLAAFFTGSFATIPDFARLWTLAHDVPELDCMGRQPKGWKQAELTWARHKDDWDVATNGVGAHLHDKARAHFEAVDRCYRSIMGRIATAIVGRLARDLDEIIAAYDAARRAAAVLDFEDLLIKARALIRRYEEVRCALGARYRYLLVDEFQDTDQIQAEVIFGIGAEKRSEEWQRNDLRAGALFLVGDPKQSVYRFRGADLACYLKARDAIEARCPENVLKITENFRSRKEILIFVNGRFAAPLRAAGLDYDDLTSTRDDPDHGLPVVSKLVVATTSTTAANIRDAEAEAVADLCERLIGKINVRKGDTIEPLTAGGITLLAPGWTDLWRYELALERRGLPIATQAGKGFYRRQEVQDLLCLARTLADSRDFLAFGALMRGPMIGLSDEELLDIVGSLAPTEDEPDAIPRFSLMTDVERVTHPVARATLGILQGLRREALLTTPGLLLAAAIERLNVRAILAARETGDGGRAIANLELFLERARGYRVRGLEQFVRDLTDEWSQKNNAQVEGQLDGDGSAINLITIHSAKGLEWPVVIPINGCTRFGPRPRLLHRPSDDTLHWIIDDVAPPPIVDARQSVETENQLERERMWYVNCTRAEELLIIPEVPRIKYPTWSSVLDLNIRGLQPFPIERLATAAAEPEAEPPNEQTAEVFRAESAAIVAGSQETRWMQPSASDGDRAELVEALMNGPLDTPNAIAPIGGGRVRGLALHKLIEEVLTGETAEVEADLALRAAELLSELRAEAEGGTVLPKPLELATTVIRTLRLPEITRLRPQLIPEYFVFAEENALTAVAGRIDAIGLDGGDRVVIDWKSDIAPTESDICAHSRQVLDYCRIAGAARGLLVYMTPGFVRDVATA